MCQSLELSLITISVTIALQGYWQDITSHLPHLHWTEIAVITWHRTEMYVFSQGYLQSKTSCKEQAKQIENKTIL